MTQIVLVLLRLLVAVMCAVSTLLIEHDFLLQRSTSVEVERRPPAFVQPYSYADGLEVKITETWTGRRLFVPVAELTVVVRNGSSHTFEAWLVGELSYGPPRQSAVRCPSWPASGDHGSVQLIAIGESSHPYRLCFVLPPTGRADTVFKLRIDAGGHEPSIFAGGM